MIWKGIYKQGPYKYASYDYILEKINDKWIFTNFELPFTYCTENGVEKPDVLIMGKSPDNKYTFEFNKENGFIDIYKDDIILLGYSIQFDMPWDEDIMELQEYWWDLEFNKMYILVGPNVNPVSHIYCIDLSSRDVTYYDTVRYNLENINKQTNYIYFTDRWKSLDVYTSNEDYYIKKKYGYYIYNLRTNEKFYLNSDDDYTLKQLNDTSIVYTQYTDGKKSGEFSIDISLYVDKNRGEYINKIKNAILKAYNNTIRVDNIELCQIFTTEQENYKINDANKSSSYEL